MDDEFDDDGVVDKETVIESSDEWREEVSSRCSFAFDDGRGCELHEEGEEDAASLDEEAVGRAGGGDEHHATYERCYVPQHVCSGPGLASFRVCCGWMERSCLWGKGDRPQISL